jgi:transposase-like protein
MEMNLADLVEQFGSNDRCREYLEHLRWPDGVKCPRCDSASVSYIKTRKQFDCNRCRKRFSVLAGTIFQDSKLPLWKWFAAVYLMCESKKGISALQIKRMLKIGSYETAWYLCHRIRAAMVEANPEPLDGTVEVDETYIGGKVRFHKRGQEGYRKNKTVVMGAIERDGQLRVRALPMTHITRKAAERFILDNVSSNVEAIYTDEAPLYNWLWERGIEHETVAHGRDEWVRGHVHTNTVESAWSLFDRAVLGSYHKLSKKHLQAYLDEFAFRFNNRENTHLFRDTILRLVDADVLTYEKLTKAA